MRGKVCVIVGSSDFFEFDFSKADYIIAADAGLLHLEKAGIEPDLVVGDFDSLGFVPDYQNVIRLSTHKDDTDTLFALRQGIEKGYKSFVLCGCTGGRIDHTIANIQALSFLASQGLEGFMLDRQNAYTVIKNNTFTILQYPNQSNRQSKATKNSTLSVISLSDISRGVYLKGVEYELRDATLSNTFPIGVSNSLLDSDATITVVEGMLLIIFPKNRMSF